MSLFICPVCQNKLFAKGKSYVCPKNHSYDISKKGYVNLLLSQHAKTKQHGDDKQMVKARRNFLGKGFYQPLMDELLAVIGQYFPVDGVLLDAGCGEGWYTNQIYDRLTLAEKNPQIMGIDISKNALEISLNFSELIERAVASVFKLPVARKSCDMVLNIFSPYAHDEFCSVLKHNGILIRVIPLAKHLWELKNAIYDSPYENTIQDVALDKYDFKEMREVKSVIFLESPEDINNLFTMTPYYYKTSHNDIEKLQNLTYLETKIEFGILVYQLR